MPGDAISTYQRLIQPQGLHVVSDNLRPLKAKRASLREGSAIPPREWLYGTMMIRKFVTTIIAPGGVGKTAWTIAAGVSLAAGKRLIGDWVHAQTNVMFCNLEDPEDEFDRRIAACMMHHKLDDEQLSGRIYMIDGRDRRLIVASLDTDGMTVIYPDKDALVATIKELQLGCLFVDPFVNSHELEENSNPHINAATRAWAEIGNLTGCAIVLVHHTRKGAIAGDADSGRGAGALIAASRAVYTLTAMDPADAKKFGIPENERKLHIRMDDAKANLSPPSEKAKWFHLASVPLGNGTPDYPNGDNVQAIEEWSPPSAWSGLDPEDLNKVLDLIAEGPEPGVQYAPTSRGRSNTRWVGQVLVDVLDMEEAQVKMLVSAWLKNGLLVVSDYRDEVARKVLPGITVNDDLRPTI